MTTPADDTLTTLATAAEAFRVAMLESGALTKVSQDTYFPQLRALETAIAVAHRDAVRATPSNWIQAEGGGDTIRERRPEDDVPRAAANPIFKQEAREGGYAYVTAPDFPGFSAMLHPGESINDDHVRLLILMATLDATSAIRRAPASPSEWQLIETVPKDKTKVLLWSVGSQYNVPGYYIGHYEYLFQGYVPIVGCTMYSSSAEQFTHWAPLLAAPSLPSGQRQPE